MAKIYVPNSPETSWLKRYDFLKMANSPEIIQDMIIFGTGIWDFSPTKILAYAQGVPTNCFSGPIRYHQLITLISHEINVANIYPPSQYNLPDRSGRYLYLNPLYPYTSDLVKPFNSGLDTHIDTYVTATAVNQYLNGDVDLNHPGNNVGTIEAMYQSFVLLEIIGIRIFLNYLT